MAKASAAQMRLLGELRAKELKDLTPAEYAMVETEVSANGFKDLKGTAAQIVFNAIRKRDKAMKKAIVEKHGNHDQSSHGSWANGGASGSGLSTQAGLPRGAGKPPPSTPEEWWKEESMLAAHHEISGMTVSDAQGAAMSDMQIKYGASQEEFFAPKMSTLKKNFEVSKHGNHDQSSHGSWSENPHNDDNPRAMDNMDTGRKLDKPTAAQRKLVARITSPASSAYVNRPFGGVQFASTWRRRSDQPQIIGYKPETSN